MKIDIQKITVMKRIRKEAGNIADLTQDIERNGLINPVTVMVLDDGKYQLLAGLRRLKAVQALGWTEIDVSAVSPKDAEEKLRIEISENEMREPFTLSEKIEFGLLLEEIERAKAQQRKQAGVKITEGNLPPNSAEGYYIGETRQIVSAKIGMGKTRYDQAKYIVKNAPEEIINELDKGERSIYSTYSELKAKEKNEIVPTVIVPMKAVSASGNKKPDEKAQPAVRKNQINDINIKFTNPMKISAKDEEAIRKLAEYNALPPDEKIIELNNQLKEQRARAATAESDLQRLQENHQNAIYHRDTTIDSLNKQMEELDAEYTAAKIKIKDLALRIKNLKTQNSALKKALDAANSRINELEGIINGNTN